MALRALGLCAGIGGIERGLAGIARGVCLVEREAFAASILAQAMEDGSMAPAPIWSDLRTFDAAAWRGRVDLVTAGFPCQPFSVAGDREGKKDRRHLWPIVLRVLNESCSPLGYFENVTGLVSKGLSEVLADLAKHGFDAEWGRYSGAAVGAPHRRDRLWILAHRPGYLASVRDRQLADRDRGRREGVWGSWLLDREPEPRHDADGRGGEDSEVDSKWPPGPRADWGRVPQRLWPGLPEPELRGVAARIPDWFDRVAALGNSVMPEVARRAFLELANRAVGEDEKNNLKNWWT